jgi:hypothetical protein
VQKRESGRSEGEAESEGEPVRATKTVAWPSGWEHSRVRAGYHLAEGHVIEQVTPSKWEVRLAGWARTAEVVGITTTLSDAVTMLADHLDGRAVST